MATGSVSLCQVTFPLASFLPLGLGLAPEDRRGPEEGEESES